MFTPTFYSPNIYIIRTFLSFLLSFLIYILKYQNFIHFLCRCYVRNKYCEGDEKTSKSKKIEEEK